MPKALFARVEPFDPKRGRTTQNVHFAGTLFRGGIQPVWYKVTDDLAAKLRMQEQPSGVPMFQIVDEDEKAVRDQEEQARRMVAMGMISDTVHKAAGDRKQEIDLTGGAPSTKQRRPRGGALPTPEEQAAAQAVAPAVGGNVTTADLPGASTLASKPPQDEE